MHACNKLGELTDSTQTTWILICHVPIATAIYFVLLRYIHIKRLINFASILVVSLKKYKFDKRANSLFWPSVERAACV